MLWREGFDILDPTQPKAVENTICDGRKEAEFGYDPLAEPSRVPQSFDLTNDVFRRGLCSLCNREKRFRRPAMPSVRKQAAHFAPVFGQIPKVTAVALGVCPSPKHATHQRGSTM